jgi:hypothetical protein
VTAILEDLAAAHQIRLTLAPPLPWPARGSYRFAVSCTCQAARGAAGRPRHEVIEARTVFPAAEALTAWRAWHEEKGIELP